MHYPKNEKGEFVVPKGEEAPKDAAVDLSKENEQRLAAEKIDVEEREKAIKKIGKHVPQPEKKKK